MSKKHIILFKIMICAIFTALSFALTFVSVPLPTGAKVHLGNFVLVLASLLFGGLIGGTSGALGMALNDIAGGYPVDTIIRTLIVKFIFGLVVGYLFRLLINKKRTTRIVLYTLTGIFVFIFILTLALYTRVPTKDGIAAFTINLFGNTKTIKLSVLVPIFSGILSLILIVLDILSLKLKEIALAVATVTTLGVLVNTVLEFLLRWLIKGIVESNFNIGLVDSISKLPSNLITGLVTIVFATAIFIPLYEALKNQREFLEISDLKINTNNKEVDVTKNLYENNIIND